MTSERRYFGRAGHLCVADRCRFHLHTHVNGWCVSTVGDFHPSPDAPRESIGYGRYYETMVFLLDGQGDVICWPEIAMDGYTDEEDAERGHEEWVRRAERGEVEVPRDE